MYQQLSLEWKGFKLPINSGFIEYFTQREVSEEWDVRLKNLHPYTQEDPERKEPKNREELLNTFKENQENPKIKEFLKNTRKLFNHFQNDPNEVINQFAEFRQFIFVIGLNFSGNSFITKELYKGMGYIPENLTPEIIGDNVPFIENSIYHNIPDESFQLKFYFEWVQFLIWLNEELPDLKYVPKKNESMSYALSRLDEIFGDRASYILTIRNPGDAYYDLRKALSIRELEYNLNESFWSLIPEDVLGLPEEELKDMTDEQQYLRLWESYHKKLIEDLPIDGSIETVPFSKRRQFVREFLGELNREYEPDDVSEPAVDKSDYWESNEVESIVEDVFNKLNKI